MGMLRKLLPRCVRRSLRLAVKRLFIRLLGLIGEHSTVNEPLQPALYINNAGFLKLRPDLSARLHQTPWVFELEAASIMQYYRGGVHLDVGCGSRKITASSIGVDIHDGSTQFVAGSVNVVTNADNLYVFADGTVDFISSLHSFEHYDDPRTVLKEWHRVLKIGGRIGIVVPALEGLIPDKELLRGHKFDYDAKTLESLISEFGSCFRILALDTLQNGWSIDLVIEKVR